MNRIKSTLLVVALLMATNGLFAQILSKSVTLKYTATEGTNGCAIAYHPKKKLYYSTIAGNKQYPLEVFDKKGTSIKADKGGFDSRGVWFSKDGLEARAFSGEVYSLTVDGNGLPSGGMNKKYAINPNNEHAIPAYDAKKKTLVFYSDGNLVFYDSKSGENKGSLSLDLYNTSNINSTTVIYTGVKNKEFGLLNHDKKEILLFDRKGNKTGTAKLPTNAVTHSMFRFSYANNLVFLYDVETRTWTGYSGLK